MTDEELNRMYEKLGTVKKVVEYLKDEQSSEDWEYNKLYMRIKRYRASQGLSVKLKQIYVGDKLTERIVELYRSGLEFKAIERVLLEENEETGNGTLTASSIRHRIMMYERESKTLILRKEKKSIRTRDAELADKLIELYNKYQNVTKLMDELNEWAESTGRRKLAYSTVYYYLNTLGVHMVGKYVHGRVKADYIDINTVVNIYKEQGSAERTAIEINKYIKDMGREDTVGTGWVERRIRKYAKEHNVRIIGRYRKRE